MRFFCNDFLIYSPCLLPADSMQKQSDSACRSQKNLFKNFIPVFFSKQSYWVILVWFFSSHANSFVPFPRSRALVRMCTLPFRRLCLPQGLHFRRKEFWLEFRWVLKIKAKKGLTQGNSVTVALFSFICPYGLNVFLCNPAWSAVRHWGRNTMDSLTPDSFYWELWKSGGKPPGLLQAEAWDQRARNHLPVGSKPVDGQFREMSQLELRGHSLFPPEWEPWECQVHSWHINSFHLYIASFTFETSSPPLPQIRERVSILQSWAC